MPDIRHLNVPIRSKFNLAGMDVYSRKIVYFVIVGQIWCDTIFIVVL